VDRVFLHCSASSKPEHDDISVIRRWHVEERGWSDVGYHYFIKFDGTIQEGRPLRRIPAAQQGHNRGSIAICLHGRTTDDFTTAQFDALRRLCRAIGQAYDGQVTFHGHCEVDHNKRCPVFAYDEVLNLDGEGYLHLGGDV
jgi:N-acetyl-anhydromuramyl-L-alanine amidase AmpD